MKSPLFRTLIVGVALVVGLYLWYCSRKPRYIAGDRAADFQVALANGQQAKLSELRGKFVLLHFWGSWCGPCRAENPFLAQLYRKYHDRGFEIFSIGEENSAGAWQKAIENDELPWTRHAIELKPFSGPVAQLYNIHAIPATFLIDPNGVILGANLMPQQIDKLLAERLSEN